MAKKHPTSSRVHRESDVPDDAFVGTIRRVIDWIQDNQREAALGTIALLAIIAVGTWIVVNQRSLEAAAQDQLAQVQQTAASGNAQLAVRDLRSFLETFGSTEAADQARLTLADLLMRQEQPADAIQALDDLPERIDEPFGLPAARLQAAALERLERYQDAVQAYERIARNARFEYQRREAMADAARVELQHGEPANAVDLFDRVLATFDDDEAGRGYYEMWLAEAQARVRTGQGAATVPTADPAADTAATG